ncbi:MAG: arsenate reductase ArsC [Deltaproteobacteria bacterium]|nr:MAG: arsenate reductase ArsC [Deltaproteobacteria bacterium]
MAERRSRRRERPGTGGDGEGDRPHRDLRAKDDPPRPEASGGKAVTARSGDWRTEAAELRAKRPRHILFLCVANSARSQMAEGIARSLAPQEVTVSSAGSSPSSVRPQAIRVLNEIGIDISGHRSKGLESIDTGSVDAVITLCAEEVCPVFLGKAHRVHWGLPDPAGVTGTEETRLDAFRSVRDELRRRLKVLFGHGDER